MVVVVVVVISARPAPFLMFFTWGVFATVVLYVAVTVVCRGLVLGPSAGGPVGLRPPVLVGGRNFGGRLSCTVAFPDAGAAVRRS